MKKRSLQSRFITGYFRLIDQKSKYQERWFYKNPDHVAPPKSIVATCSVSSIKVEQRNVWIIKPKESQSENNILYIHGGCFAKNFQSHHWRFIERLAIRANATVYAPDYPLIPDHNFESIHNYLIKAYEQVLNLSPNSELTIIGDSSGATLALNLGNALKSNGLQQPKEYILLSPWLDLSLSNPLINMVNEDDPLIDVETFIQLGKIFAGNLSINDARISPIYADLRRLAPITIFVGTKEIMLADCRKLRCLMSSQPVVFNYREFNGMFHNWMFFDFLEGKKALGMIIDQIIYKPSELEQSIQEHEISW